MYAIRSYYDEDNNGTADFSLSTVTIKGETNSPDIVTKSYNDKYGRVVKQSRKFSEVEHFDTFTYDYIGNKIQERQARAYVEGWTEPWTSKYEYNFAGKPVKVYNIDGSYITTQYDALQRINRITSYNVCYTKLLRLDEWRNLDQTYHYMLKYTVEGINDPERKKIYQKLIVSAFRNNFV